jgi:hypothetical protein
MKESPITQLAPACRGGNVFASAKFPRRHALLPYRGLADAITPNQIIFTVTNAARLLRSDGSTMELLRNFPHSIEPNLSG